MIFGIRRRSRRRARRRTRRRIGLALIGASFLPL